jgi:predicted RNA binding protein YcfA (HicA-like mRNA interferase family)
MEARHFLKELKDGGWYLWDTAGASRQYVHPGEAGVVTVCVRYTDRLGPESVLAARTPALADVDGDPEIAMEPTASGLAAWSPQLSGCAATGRTEEETLSRMMEALALHRTALSGR